MDKLGNIIGRALAGKQMQQTGRAPSSDTTRGPALSAPPSPSAAGNFGLSSTDATKLMGDPEIMRLMSSPDFQALVSDVMGGSEEAQMAILEDPRKAAMLDKFAMAMRAAGIAPPAGR